MSELNENELPYGDAIRIAGLIHKTREKQPLTEEEQQQLDAWRNSSGSNTALLASLSDHNQVAEELEAMLRYDEDKGVQAVFKALEIQPRVARGGSRKMIGWLAVAASLLLLLGVGWWFFVRQNNLLPGALSSAAKQPGFNKAVLTMADGRQVLLDGAKKMELGIQGAARVEQQDGRLIYTANGKGPVAYNTITTPRGGQYRLVMADGSEIWLNAASSIRFPTSFAGNTREVTITGEAYFSVAKDKTKPFFVTAPKMKVQVVGTEFNVMAYSNEDAVRTTLINGVVKASSTVGQEMTLRPGEQATLVRRSGKMELEKPAIEDVIAWRFGEFRFHETDMTAIMRQIERWYDVKIEYRGPVANIGFSGQISRKEHVKDLLDILSDTRNVHFEIEDEKTIIVIPGPK